MPSYPTDGRRIRELARRTAHVRYVRYGRIHPIDKARKTNELSLIGGFVFSVGGDALLGISAGSQRLLAFLALRDRAVTRNQVAGTFWPESSGEHAGASLRSAVSRLAGPAREASR